MKTQNTQYYQNGESFKDSRSCGTLSVPGTYVASDRHPFWIWSKKMVDQSTDTEMVVRARMNE